MDRQARAREVVGAVIEAWDPYGLLAMGAPADEFDTEVRSIAARIDELYTVVGCTTVVSQVFKSAFGSDPRFEEEQLRDVGVRLHRELVIARLAPLSNAAGGEAESG